MKPSCLITHEYSGKVRDAMAAAGWDAWSCDLLPSEAPGNHLQCDAREAILSRKWQFLGCHPPCTYLTASALWRNRGNPDRAKATEDALAEVRWLLRRIEEVGRGYLENPVGRIGTAVRPYDCAIQPFEYNEDASKKTAFWTVGLPKLVANPKDRVPERWVTHNGKLLERWSNQTDSGQNRLGPSEDRWKLRSTTYPGVARAIANQWGNLNPTTP